MKPRASFRGPMLKALHLLRWVEKSALGVAWVLALAVSGAPQNTDSHGQQALYQEALNYTQHIRLRRRYDQVMNAFQNHQVQTSGDESSRFASHLGNTLEHLENERSEATASFQKADSYRQMASLAEEESVNINSQGNQVFLSGWLNNLTQMVAAP